MSVPIDLDKVVTGFLFVPQIYAMFNIVLLILLGAECDLLVSVF